MRYQVMNDIYDDVDSAIAAAFNENYYDDDWDSFEEWINEAYEGANIGRRYFSPYDIVDRCDEDFMYDLKRDYDNDRANSDKEDATWDLTHGQIGETVWLHGTEIEILEDEVEETGDYDGDDAVEVLRLRLNNEEKQKIDQETEDKQTENELMKMLQIIA